MKRVLLFATTTGYQTRMFGEAAERLGVRLVFATDRCDQLDDPWWDGAIAVRFQHEAASVDELRRALGTRPVDGVLALGDRPTILAAHAACLFGVPFHSPDAARAARDKRLTRKRFADAGLRAPTFIVASLTEDPRSLAARVPFPCVVKPTGLSGSRGVIRANNEHELVAAFERVRRLLSSIEMRASEDGLASAILIEEYIDGQEYAVEAVLERGALCLTTIFDKPDPLDGPFFEETLYVTPSRAHASRQTAIIGGVTRAAGALGLSHGPIHAECRVNARGVFVLEVAARPIGGLCARALAFVDQAARRATLEELLLRHAVGESLAEWRRETAASGVMMIPIPRQGIYRGVEGQAQARKVRGVDDVMVTAKPDQRLVPLPEGASYLGFIFAHADDPSRVEIALRAAHDRLTFAIDPALPML
ncbi:MAG: ATP-grasp domain-containing protein [Vicinamibacterales bacterium]